MNVPRSVPAWCRDWRSVADPRRYPLSKLLALAGIAYLFVPLDVVPDRLPYVGHLDEIGFLFFGLAGARWLAPPPEPATRPVSGRIRRRARRVAGSLCAYPALRATLGRWPSRDEARRFRRGFVGRGPVPPLLRAVANVPAARPQLTRTMLASWAVADPASRAELRAGLAGGEEAGDLFRVWTGPRIGFLHLEKTAGSALGAALQDCFHPLQICPLRPTEILPASDPGAQAQARRWSLLWGHYDLPRLLALDPDRFLIAFFREPGARLVSLYNFWRQVAPAEIRRSERSAGVRLAQELSFRDFLRSDHPVVVDAVDNYYVRRLTGLYREDHGCDPLLADEAAALAEGCAALSRLDFVGVTERLDEGVRVLGRMLDFAPPRTVPRLNASRRAEGDPTLGAEAELAACTRLDRVIYAAAVDRFRASARCPEPA